MDINAIVNMIIQVINGCGFPIFGCCALGWFVVWSKKQSQENRRYNYENLKVAIDNQTEALRSLTDLIKEAIRRD